MPTKRFKVHEEAKSKGVPTVIKSATKPRPTPVAPTFYYNDSSSSRNFLTPTVASAKKARSKNKSKERESESKSNSKSKGKNKKVQFNADPKEPPPPTQPETDILELLKQNDVAKLVLGPLPLQTKRAARLVCKYWEEVLNPLLKWHPVISDSTVVAVKDLGDKMTSPSTFQSLIVQPPLHTERYSDAGPLKMPKVVFRPESGGEEDDPVGVSQGNFEAILADVRNAIKSLYINSKCFGGSEPASGIFIQNLGFPYLTSLVVAVSPEGKRGLSVCTQLLQKRFPSLEKVNISVQYGIGEVVRGPPIYGETYGFLCSHKDVLKEVRLHQSGAIPKSSVYHIPTDCEGGFDLKEEITRRGLTEVRLKTLELVPSLLEGRRAFHFGTVLLSSQSCLTEFRLLHVHRANIGLLGVARSIISRCSSTLTRIVLSGCICPPEEDRDYFSCSIFEGVQRLGELRLYLCGMPLLEVENLPMSIKTLDLGPDLTVDQIEVLSHRMTKVEKLYLFQNNALYFPQVPILTLNIFHLVLKHMTGLTRVVVLKECCSWEDISAFVDAEPGLKTSENCEAAVIRKPHAGIDINRKIYGLHQKRPCQVISDTPKL